MKKLIGLLVIASACLVVGSVRAQQQAPDRATLARNPKLLLETLTKGLKWTDPAEPVKIVGPIYFVGTRGLGVYLFATSEGLILMNTGMPGSGPMIARSIRTLGFKPEDIKLLLACHGHIDHVGGHAYMKKLSGATVVMGQSDAELMRSGGKMDFFYGTVREFAFEPVTTDRVIRDGDTIRLGEVAIVARITPGHTKGSTTFITDVVDGGKLYTVVFADGAGLNPGYHVVQEPSYPRIDEDYRHTLQVLEDLKPDIWLTPHNEVYDLEGKRARAAQEGVHAWVDPEGYRRYVAGARETFEDQVDAELGVPPKGK